MSSTRHAQPDSPLNQERYSSSPEFHRGLLAQHVAKRCSVLRSAKDRELIWALQRRSWDDGGLAEVSKDILTRFPQYLGTASMHAFGIAPGKHYSADQVKQVRREMGAAGRREQFILKGELTPAERLSESALIARHLGNEYGEDDEAALQRLGAKHPATYPVKAFIDACIEEAKGLADALAKVCLDPECNLESCWYLPDLRSALQDYFRETIAEARAKVVVTEIGQAVCDALDYAMAERCMVLIDGVSRTGKTCAAKAWAAQRPGRVRYLEVPSSNDEISFLIRIARALSISVESNPKAQKLRDRIERVLQDGDLMVIFDEAHYLWPQSNYRHAKPARVNWIMTALVNQNVPVALVTTPQFMQARLSVEKMTGWTAQQFDGRLGHYERLLDSLKYADLLAVAAVQLPNGDRACINALADLAAGSGQYLAIIEKVAKRARYIARKNGREEPSRDDVRGAIKENVIPSDSALASVLTPKEKAIRRATAAPPQEVRRKAAAPLQAGAPRLQKPLSTDLGSAVNRSGITALAPELEAAET